ncbi:hypothetical protein AB8O64_29675 [Streptomyces sp. QH1-20]|uniref:hypothetical protein n=1 Tax=Streptomyces sp. QH1-20 TaxID=3240934 RepID=UPI00351312C1
MDTIEEFLRAKGPFMAGGPIIETLLRRRDEALAAGLEDEAGVLENLMLDVGKLLGDQGDPDWREEWITEERDRPCTRCGRVMPREMLARLKDGGLACRAGGNRYMQNYYECREIHEVS